uniref:Uncharacterized protein n=1 Tax=Rhizophora mucronata TaxID=61149 RepID=A0A2P2R4S3_RHIMU
MYQKPVTTLQSFCFCF